MTLESLGWSGSFARDPLVLANPSLSPMRVVRQNRHRYVVLGEAGQRVAEPTGNLLSHSDGAASLPVVGDWVLCKVEDSDRASIHHRLERSGSFSRKVAGDTTREQVVAANIDTILLVTGLDGDYNLRRIERYLTLAWNSGATPVVVLSKADLVVDPQERIDEVRTVAYGVDVVAVSTVGNPGMAAVSEYLMPGRTIALLGSSGVGKSSMVNAILGRDVLETTPVREDDQRGRHTTTFRELFVAPSGALVIDTPGMREVQLWADESDVQSTFPDIEELASACHFADCMHETEPGCAVQEALASGELDEGRFNSWLKLMREAAWLDRRRGESKRDQRQRERSQSKLYKQILNEKRRRE